MRRVLQFTDSYPAPHLAAILDVKIAKAARTGLTSSPKSLPSWLLYDDAGQRLFDRLTRLPEYYLTRTEQRILESNGDDILAAASGPEHLSVWELGAGHANKSLGLLRTLVHRQGRADYLPIDTTSSALWTAELNVRQALPAVHVHSRHTDSLADVSLNARHENRWLVLCLGSSIGNGDFTEAVKLLRNVRRQLQPGDALLLGTDMMKPSPVLHSAYNDSLGVTATFNKNLLLRLNRELAADFDLSTFEHRAVWNWRQCRMEMHLVSRIDQTVHLRALDCAISLTAEESIHTQNSYKFTEAGVTELLECAGFLPEKSWFDDRRWYGVHLARAKEWMEYPLHAENAA